MLFLVEALEKFWRQQPALLYALAVLLGINSALSWNAFYLLPIGLMVLPLAISTKMLYRLLLAFSLMAGAYLYVSTAYVFPKLSPEGEAGTAYLDISSVSSKATHFGKQWSYRGTIRKFESTDGKTIARNIPYVLSIPQNETTRRPSANRSYLASGKLKELMPGYYTLNVSKDSPWLPIDGTWSLAEWRLRTKQYVAGYIREHIAGSRVSTFLAGIATGDFDDRSMFFEFGRFGLQHIMAISGFHFAIIAAILSALLRVIVRRRTAMITMIFLLSSYFVFLGCASSIMRAWITILIVLFGSLIEKRGSGLNSLGVAMLALLIYDPPSCQSLGFQFSFIVTAAILLFYPGCDLIMQRLLKKRPLSHVIEMDAVNQHGYCVLSFFRQALALTIAVNLIALPMTLFFFHKFPVQSLIYNLFFPFIVSISMLLLILGIIFSVIPPVGAAIHALNQYYSQFLLNFIYNMPTSLDVVWRISAFPMELLIVYLCAVFWAGACLKHYLDLRQEEFEDLKWT